MIQCISQCQGALELLIETVNLERVNKQLSNIAAIIVT